MGHWKSTLASPPPHILNYNSWKWRFQNSILLSGVLLIRVPASQTCSFHMQLIPASLLHDYKFILLKISQHNIPCWLNLLGSPWAGTVTTSISAQRSSLGLLMWKQKMLWDPGRSYLKPIPAMKGKMVPGSKAVALLNCLWMKSKWADQAWKLSNVHISFRVYW